MVTKTLALTVARERGRRPRGSTAGGQFTTRQRTGAAVTLDSDLDAAQNPETDATVLSQLAFAKPITIRRAVAQNPATPENSLERLLRHEVPVRQAVLRNPGIPETLALRVAGRPRSGDLADLARNPATTGPVLRLCSGGTIVDRSIVAARRDAPQEVLDHLAETRSPQVLAALINNASASKATRARAQATLGSVHTELGIVETKAKGLR